MDNSTNNAENVENTENQPKSYSEANSQADLVKELAIIAMTHSITGKIDASTVQMLVQAALLADILTRKEDADKKLLEDLQTESFSKDIEIATLRAELEGRAL